MFKNLLYYKSLSYNPYENLSTEKYLFDNLPKESILLYLWQNQNTVVIGKNQNPWAECSCEIFEKEGVILSRRLSGGGAVFHDLGNLNFTFIYESENDDIYLRMEVIKRACEMAGINATVSGRNDILAEGKKFSGNAFYNSNGKGFHHGTILVSTNLTKMNALLTPPKAKLEAKGVKSVKSRVVNLSEFVPSLTPQLMAEYMLAAFAEIYKGTPKYFSEIDINASHVFANEYKKWEYNYGKTFPFTVSYEYRFDWGHISIQMIIKDGIINDLQIYTDSLNTRLSDILKENLKGCAFLYNEIEKNLDKISHLIPSEDIKNLFLKNMK